MAVELTENGYPWLLSVSSEAGITIQHLAATPHREALVFIDIWPNKEEADAGKNPTTTIQVSKDTFMEALKEEGLV